MKMTFVLPVRVYYEDTDSGGVVYHANYLKFMERGRTEYLRQLGFEQNDLIKSDNIIFAVHTIQLDYHKPARFNEMLEVHTHVTECKKASLLFDQQVIRPQDNALLCSGKIRVACLRADTFKPCAMPHSVLEKISVN